MILAIQIAFFVMIITGVIMMVATKNIVHAAYALALVLISMAGVYVLLFAELLAVVQILLYAGGVIILLLFGVMMTNRVKGDKLITENREVILASSVAILIFSGLIFLFSKISFQENVARADQDQVAKIGFAFLTEHLVAFELIAFILLVALVGAAYLAKMSSNE